MTANWFQNEMEQKAVVVRGTLDYDGRQGRSSLLEFPNAWIQVFTSEEYNGELVCGGVIYECDRIWSRGQLGFSLETQVFVPGDSWAKRWKVVEDSWRHDDWIQSKTVFYRGWLGHRSFEVESDDLELLQHLARVQAMTLLQVGSDWRTALFRGIAVKLDGLMAKQNRRWANRTPGRKA